MAELIDCEEFGEISVPISSLISGGEVRFDERIVQRGYVSVSIKDGRICLRATKFVGIFPLNEKLWIRVRPRANIASLSYILIESGAVPRAIPEFSRGYTPVFLPAEGVERLYAPSLLRGIERVLRKGFSKSYIDNLNSPPGRGRLMVAETAKMYAAKGIKYRHRFRQSILTSAIVRNIALREAVVSCLAWFRHKAPKDPMKGQLEKSLLLLRSIPPWHGKRSELVRELSREIRTLPASLGYYSDPLWVSLLLLQRAVPELSGEGFVKLESLIVDVSIAFEGYVRNKIAQRLQPLGYEVVDGNKVTFRLFDDTKINRVQPDIVIMFEGRPLLILDVKYKPSVSEQDRYELMAFMDALNVSFGGFVCPSVGDAHMRRIGRTRSGKHISCLRLDLSSQNSVESIDSLMLDVLRLIDDCLIREAH
ncbi:5-methylcytosine restriction system specificity protein McrC [Stenotrophomonas maltophilia]|uniref:5-methylcytosine restriction system specificity protein McrC n=1 Tax=Stenotrophomonas maltophilia TaxID=40324 RepID=UPI003D7DBC1F